MLERGNLGPVEKDRLEKVVAGEVDLSGMIYRTQDVFDIFDYRNDPDVGKIEGRPDSTHDRHILSKAQEYKPFIQGLREKTEELKEIRQAITDKMLQDSLGFHEDEGSQKELKKPLAKALKGA